MSSDGQINVYFYKDHLNEFVCPTSWKQARLRTQRQNLERSVQECPPSWKKNILHVPLPLPSIEKKSVSRTNNWENAPCLQKGLPECLLSSIQMEKEESKKFEDQLCCWLREDPHSLAVSFPPPLLSPVSQSISSVICFSTMAGMQATRMEDVPSVEKSDLSLSKRLKHLERLIKATKDEDKIYKFHLSTLRDLGDL